MTREETNARSLLEGSAPATVAGLAIRPLTLSTITVLELLGNPLAASVTAGESGGLNKLSLSMYQLSEVVWVHSADEAAVRTLALAYAWRPDELRAAVLEHVSGIGMEDLVHVMAFITGEREACSAASVHLLPQEGEPSKNGHGHPCAPASSSPLPASPDGRKEPS